MKIRQTVIDMTDVEEVCATAIDKDVYVEFIGDEDVVIQIPEWIAGDLASQLVRQVYGQDLKYLRDNYAKQVQLGSEMLSTKYQQEQLNGLIQLRTLFGKGLRAEGVEK